MTPSKFPLVTTPLQIGGREWRIASVQNQDALLDGADELEHFPYGFLLWESAVGLARYLAANPELAAGKRLLELGAGVGLPGLVARTLGAQVWQTDHQPGALALAQTNAEQNGVQGVTRFLADWRVWTHTERYDLLLGADILYERAMHFHLEAIFQRNLAPGGRLLLSDPDRPQATEFLARLERRGWRFALDVMRVSRLEAAEAQTAVPVAILRGRPPGFSETAHMPDHAEV
jgi:predicted nicotinamide N-methyase